MLRKCERPGCDNPLPLNSNERRRYCSKPCQYEATAPQKAMNNGNGWNPRMPEDEIAAIMKGKRFKDSTVAMRER